MRGRRGEEPKGREGGLRRRRRRELVGQVVVVLELLQGVLVGKPGVPRMMMVGVDDPICATLTRRVVATEQRVESRQGRHDRHPVPKMMVVVVTVMQITPRVR